MKSQTRVVVIGGGVVGCSVLYHLAQRGWTDSVLVEMNELTSGSTWHAAGNIPTFSPSRNIIKLQHYSTQLYDTLANDSEHPIGYHRTGSVRIAQSEQRMDEYRHVADMANAMGFGYELLDKAAMQAKHPFLETDDLVGGLWDPADGDIDPSQLTQALAAESRKLGAEIYRFTRVTGITRTASKEWTVATDKGDIQCEIIVNAGGYRGTEVSELAGRYLPLVTMEHQYLVTDSIPEIAELDGNLPLLRDPDDSYYLRREKNGLILGPYEWQATPHWPDGQLPPDFAYELFANDLDRLEWYIERACERMPLLGTVGVQRVINGPIPYSPNGLPYVGPAFGLPNFYHCCGFSFGICQGGGAGKAMAEWIVDGKPEWDLWSIDPRRYTAYADQNYVTACATEVYQNEYAMQFPDREWPAGRPALTSPLYERLKAKGAVFGARGGWERAVWFPRGHENGESEPGFRRGSWFDAVDRECRHVAEQVGVLDLSGFTKYELEGPGAGDWLDRQLASALPKVGRLSLGYACAEDGGLWSELTVTRLEENRFLLVSAAAARWHDLQWLENALPDDARFTLRDVTEESATLIVAGPRSRELLQSLTQSDLSNESFRWLTAQTLTIAGVELLALRVNFIGELGWELHVPVEHHVAVYDALFGETDGAHDDFQVRDFGLYAMDSMRLEKCYRTWKGDLDSEYSPLRSGLHRFVDLDKPDFVGRDALLAEHDKGAPDTFVALRVDADDADAMYGATITLDGETVGYATSGGYGHRVEHSIALGYVNTELAKPGTELIINILGKPVAASIVEEPIFDPKNERLRA